MLRQQPVVSVTAFYLIGSLLLPIAPYGHLEGDVHGYVQVLGCALPYGPWMNRAVFLGPASLCLAWYLSRLADWAGRSSAPGPRRLAAIDGWMIAWLVTPLVTGWCNGSPFSDSATQSLYLTCVWGAPYAATRWTYRSSQDLLAVIKVTIKIGALTFALAMLEFSFGRFFYTAFYGYQPYMGEGPTRYFGYRPLLFMEDPNQIGMWWATLAIMSVGLQRLGWPLRTSPILGWGLATTPFLFQAIGAAILSALGFALSFSSRKIFTWTLVGVIVMCGAGIMLRGRLLQVGREFIQSSSIGPTVKNVLRHSSIGSFGWRMGLEEASYKKIRERIGFGWGSVNFWKSISEQERPWGLATLITGAYGLVGLGVWSCLWLVPLRHCVAMGVRRGSLITSDESWPYVQLLLIVLLVHMLDAFMNSAYLLPCLCYLGLVNSYCVENGLGGQLPSRRSIAA